MNLYASALESVVRDLVFMGLLCVCFIFLNHYKGVAQDTTIGDELGLCFFDGNSQEDR